MADIESALISELAASNTAPSPDGLPPNSSPNIVYTQGREALAMAKRAWNRLGPTVTSGGSANAQTLSYTSNPTALIRGQGYCFIAGFTNTGPMTLTVGALAATNVFIDGVALQGGEVRTGLIIEVFYDGTNFQITSGRALVSLASALGGSMRNFLFNPLFNVQQRGAQNAFNQANLANTSPYTVDRWYFICNVNQINNVQVAQQFGDPRGPFILVINRNNGQTGTGLVWLGQPFDTDMIQLLAGQQVTIAVALQAQAGFSAPNVTLQLVAGTGTPTRSFSFTGTTTVCSVTQVIPAGGSLITISATGVIPANTRQLEFRIVWTPAGTAAGDSLNIQLPRLNLGPVDLGPDLTRIYTTELPICQRFFQKSFNAGVAPAQNTGIGTGEFRGVVTVGGAVVDFIYWNLPVVMRGAPAYTSYNPAAANAFMRNITKSTDASATTAFGTGINTGQANGSGLAGWAAGDQTCLHVTAEAEIA